MNKLSIPQLLIGIVCLALAVTGAVVLTQNITALTLVAENGPSAPPKPDYGPTRPDLGF